MCSGAEEHMAVAQLISDLSGIHTSVTKREQVMRKDDHKSVKSFQMKTNFKKFYWYSAFPFLKVALFDAFIHSFEYFKDL